MTAGHTGVRSVVLAALVTGLVGVGLAPAAAGTPDHVGLALTTGQPATSELELVTQTATVGPGGRFDLFVRLGEAPAAGSVELVIHGRVRSRSELATSIEGSGLRSVVHRVAHPIAGLPAEADGSRRISLSLDPTAPGGVALSAAGAYPVEVISRDASGAPLSTLVTHLLIEPGATDASPPLGVAIVAELGAPPALQPDGTRKLDTSAVDAIAGLVTALASSPSVATLAVRPETIVALSNSPAPEHVELLERLRALSEDHPLLVMPFAESSPDALLEASLGEEMRAQLDAGRFVLESALGAAPSTPAWLADAALTSDGVALLSGLGVRHVVVSPDQVEPLRPGVLTFSLAQPFLIGVAEGPGLDALALDQAVIDRVDTSVSVGLEVSRVLAELAMLWFERPGIPRSAVIPVNGSVRPEVVGGLLAGLERGRIFGATTLDRAFTDAAPLLQPGGVQVDRDLIAEEPPDISAAVARSLGQTRVLLTSFTGMVGVGSELLAPMATHVLLSTSVALDEDEQRAHLVAARGAIGSLSDGISAPGRQTITLTARAGTVPLTLRNDTGTPVNVVVRLRSPKLEFPDGDTIPLVLTDPTTRVDISVRARASGSFPIQVEVTSPDGAVTVAAFDYSVQSTAVAGAGVVLSAGAAIFLMVWWARHWSRTRRSSKLVTSGHPSHRAAGRPPPSQ